MSQQYKVQSLSALREQMKAVARGDIPAPKDAAEPSYNSVEAALRLLTPENRELMVTIRDRKPQSVAELATLTGRAPSNLSRTLAKLEAHGFVALESHGKVKAPVVQIEKIVVEIDPYSLNDRLVVA